MFKFLARKEQFAILVEEYKLPCRKWLVCFSMDSQGCEIESWPQLKNVKGTKGAKTSSSFAIHMQIEPPQDS